MIISGWRPRRVRVCVVPRGMIVQQAPRERLFLAADLVRALSGDDVNELVGVGVGVIGERIAQLHQR